MSLWLLHSICPMSLNQESVPCPQGLLQPLVAWWTANRPFSVSQTPGTELHQVHPHRSLHPVQETEANVSFPWEEMSPNLSVLGGMCHVGGTLPRWQPPSHPCWRVQCQTKSAQQRSGVRFRSAALTGEAYGFRPFRAKSYPTRPK